MIKARPDRPVPYGRKNLPVHTIWDLGWNDAMAVIMVRQPLRSSVVNVINYCRGHSDASMRSCDS